MSIWKLRQSVEPGIVPDLGAEMMARKSPVDPFERACVLRRRPTHDGERVRLVVLWLSGPHAGRLGHLYVPVDGWPPMVRPAV
ncbi:hypothetical protein ACQEV9_07575 [Streptomyces chartreusis]|uniref:hypothetical protein n=1 Tax=Streptomyces chartreusis TaxID=1969 RepID=UPI003D8C0FB7